MGTRVKGFVLLVIIFAVLNMIPSHDFYLSEVRILLPIKEIDLFQELFLVKFEFPHCLGGHLQIETCSNEV